MRKLLFLSGIALVSVGAALTAPASAGQDITLSQVLAAPNDLSLNLAYAEQQMDRGDYLRAAATLERLLLLEPGWHEVRVLYAVSLMRIGDNAGAQAQLDLLEDSQLPDSLLKPVRAYSARATANSKPTRLGGSINIGAGYDSNAGTLTIEDFDSLNFQEQEESSFVYGGTVRLEHDLSKTTDTMAYAQASLSGKEFSDDLLGGYLALASRVGISREAGGHTLDGSVRARQFWISGDKYLSEVGLGVSYTRALTPSTSLMFDVSVHDQEYEDIFLNFASFEELRSGTRWDYRAVLEHKFGGKARGAAGIEYQDKSADFDELAYEVIGVQGALDLFPNDALYIDLDAAYRDYSYKSGPREDELTYLRGALGLRLAALFSGGGETINRFGTEIGIYHSDRQSTISAFDFDNTGAEIRLVYRFGN